MKVWFFFFFLLLPFNSLIAQEFGGNLPSLQWNQINTPVAKIIFPVGLDTVAAEVATITEKMYQQQASSLGNKLRKVNIVLQNQTLQPNGFVTLAPYHSEFFLAPNPNSFELGSLPWHQTLAIHEFRHVQQFSNFNKGVSKFFAILLGEQGQAAANGLTIPAWFWEGDAVCNETQISSQGRGRLPSFFNDYAALLKEKRNYGWMKLRNGSLQDFIPTHYPLGYLMVAYGRQKYGDDFWKNITQDAARYRNILSFTPFQDAVKRYAGVNYKQFRKNALHYFDSLNVEERLLSNEANQAIAQSKQHKHFEADYNYPYIIGKDSVLVLKKTYHSIPSFYIIDKTGEHRLRAMDIHFDDYYSYRNGKIVYASYKPDIRWGNRDRMRIVVMDIASKKEYFVTKPGRYFSPDIDSAGNRIVAVALDNKGEAALNLVDINTQKITAIPNSEHLFFTYPKFLDQENIVSAARTKEGKMALAQVNLKNGHVQYLTSVTNRIIGFPSITEEYIYFSASDKWADEQFAIHRSNGKIFKITHDNVSSYQPNVKNNKMVRVMFTATGYQLLQHQLDSAHYELLDNKEWENRPADSVYTAVTDSGFNVLKNLPQKTYAIQPYKKSTRLFNFHSWRPYYEDPEFSFTIYGNNVLNTFQSELAYVYNQNEASHKASYNAFYGGWYPYINVGINYTFNRTRLSLGKQVVHWNEAEASAGLQIPFNLTSGRHITFLNLGSNYTINKPEYERAFRDSFDNRAFTYLSTAVSFSRQVQRAVQDIYPRFSQSLSFRISNAITNRNGYQWLATGSLYFPGLLRNHNLILQGAYQEHDKDGDIGFSNSFPFSRGYTAFNFQQMQKLGVNYHLPLFYPDWGFAGIVYFLRVRTNLFYDYSRVTDSRLIKSFPFKSTGAEIYIDTKWWNEFPLTFGLRYSRLLDDDVFGRGPNQWQIIWPTVLF